MVLNLCAYWKGTQNLALLPDGSSHAATHSRLNVHHLVHPHHHPALVINILDCHSPERSIQEMTGLMNCFLVANQTCAQ